MLFWIYWLITAVIAALVVRELWNGNDWRRQLSAALVLIPLLLRALLIK
jgi:hypothetical protein